jgi:hypothetical protein
MNIDIGDLVTIRQKSTKSNSLGIVIKKHNSNRGLEKSTHVNHIIKILPQIFYVYAFDNISQGPYLHSDLLLQQTYTKIQKLI